MVRHRTESTIEATGRFGNILCPQCELASLSLRHCKAVCEVCGYVESCEDNFVPNQAGPSVIASPES